MQKSSEIMHQKLETSEILRNFKSIQWYITKRFQGLRKFHDKKILEILCFFRDLNGFDEISDM